MKKTKSLRGTRSNSVVVLLGRVHGASAVPCCVEMTIRCYNTVDMLEGRSHYGDDIEGYASRSGLEAILENLRDHLQICYHIRGVDEVLKEEDSS